MPFAAFDLHKKEIEILLADDQGQTLLRQRIPTTRQAITAFARQHFSPDTIVFLEATTNTWPVVSLLRPFVQEVRVSNPMKTRAIAEAKIKTDKVDASVLLHLGRTNFLPLVWIPNEETQIQRQRATERATLTSDRTRIKNRIHSILHHRLIAAPPGELFGPTGLQWLAELELDPLGREQLNRELRLLQALETELAGLTQSIAEASYADPRVKLLMSIPGVDFTVAQALIAVLGDISRFPSADQCAAYLGLVPSTRQSGDHCYHGRITKQGSGHARWLLVQAAQHIRAHPGPLGVFFRRLRQRKNYNVAVVATARKIVTIAWHMLKNNEPYRYAQSRSTDEKLARLRKRVTKSKRPAQRKGQPRSATYGQGIRLRKLNALDFIYEREGLPPLADPKPGEQAMLERLGLAQQAADLRTTRKIPRPPKKDKTTLTNNTD